MVVQQILVLYVRVRILVGQHYILVLNRLDIIYHNFPGSFPSFNNYYQSLLFPEFL